MKTNQEKPKKTILRHIVLFLDNLLNHILLLVTALVFLFGFYALWDSNQVYSLASSSEYEAYRPVSSSQKDELASFSGFEKLQKLNPEVIGWINVYGTNIDYPLVQAKDNEKYLTRDSKGEFASTGAIFLDARNNPKFEDFNTKMESCLEMSQSFQIRNILNNIAMEVSFTMDRKKGLKYLKCWKWMLMISIFMIQGL